MKTKKISAFIVALMMCLTLIQPYISAADAVKLTVIDATQGHENHPSSNLVDGDKKTSWGMNWLNGTTAYAIFKAPTKITAYAYAITTGEDAQSYKNRNPKDWTLYGSNDYDETTKTDGTWVELDQIQNDTKLNDANSQSYEYDITNTVPYLYYKLEITANRGNNFLKIGEFELFDAANKPVTFTAVDGTPGNNGQEYNKLFDNDTKTKWCMDKTAAYVVAKASDTIIVNGYTLTTANDNSSWNNRNPKDWTLYGSNDYDETTKTDGTWEAIHSITDDNVMQDVDFTSYSFDCSDNTKSYTYYKLDITKNKGATATQLSELAFTYTVDIHNWEEISREAPTCTTPGNSIQKCKDCGITRIIEIPVIEHAWEVISGTKPTCFDGGEAAEECSICHEKRETILSPLGHIKGEDGKCSRCSKYIIKVGSNYYCDLQEAVNAALSNDVVTMLSDISIQNTLTVGTKTLDLNGFTLKKINSGRVINVSGDFTLKDSSENHTGIIIGGSDTDGGGVYVNSYDTFNMQGGTISGCSATNNGGGVYVTQNGKFNMSGSAVIENCTAGNYGGGIKNINSIVTITNGRIANCTATVDGGGIYAGDSSVGGALTMSDSTVENCTAVQNGGGIFAEKASVTLTNCNVNENNANNYAGGIYARNGSILKMNGCTVQKNTVNNSGGGVFAGGGIADLKNCNVNENTAKNSGGGVAMNGAELILENTHITNNISTSSGGGIYAENQSTLTVTNSYIQKNTTTGNGGGIYAITASNINFNSGNIDGNGAEWGGGVYLHKGSSITLSDGSYITNNTAKNNGGGIILNEFVTVKIGGKWTNKRPTLTMTGGSISHNEAVGDKSDGNGGGICGQKKAVINISGGTIECNKAVNGGGIALFADSALSLSGTADISQSTAKLNGGGVYINNQSKMTLGGRSRISQNNSSGSGSGIYVDGALSVSGAPQVSGNVIVLSETESGETKTAKSNIYLQSGKTISASNIGIYEGETGYITPSLYFTAENGTADITDSCEDFSDYFFSDNIDYAVAYKDGAIKLLTGHKVTFVYDEERTEVFAVADGYKVKEPEGEPWRNGYAFVGWQLDGNAYDFKTPVTKDITLTPKWVSTGKPTVNVSYSKVYVGGFEGKSKVYLAAYNENGALIDLHIETIEAGYTKSFAELGFNTDGASEISAFLWSENMQPLCNKDFIELK